MFAVVCTCDIVPKSTSGEDFLAGGDIYLAVKECPAFHDILVFSFFEKERRRGRFPGLFLFVSFRAKTPTQTNSTNHYFCV